MNNIVNDNQITDLKCEEMIATDGGTDIIGTIKRWLGIDSGFQFGGGDFGGGGAGGSW